MNEIIKLKKTLPDYLKDIIDERPKIDISIRLNSISIAVGLSADVFETIDFDLDEQIQNYIFDYYPSIAKLKITTQKYIKNSSLEDDYDNIIDKDNVEEYETVDEDSEQ